MSGLTTTERPNGLDLQPRGLSGMSFEAADISLNSCWYAVWTRSRQEKATAAILGSLGVTHFLPLTSELRQWSDRKRQVEMPLFCGYLFVRIDLSSDNRLQVLKAPGVVGLVGNHLGPLPIPDYQIDSISQVQRSGVACVEYPYLAKGDRVRIVRGALAGVEGTLLRNTSEARLILSVEMIQRSVAVTVLQQDIEPVLTNAA